MNAAKSGRTRLDVDRGRENEGGPPKQARSPNCSFSRRSSDGSRVSPRVCGRPRAQGQAESRGYLGSRAESSFPIPNEAHNERIILSKHRIQHPILRTMRTARGTISVPRRERPLSARTSEQTYRHAPTASGGPRVVEAGRSESPLLAGIGMAPCLLNSTVRDWTEGWETPAALRAGQSWSSSST